MPFVGLTMFKTDLDGHLLRLLLRKHSLRRHLVFPSILLVAVAVVVEAIAFSGLCAKDGHNMLPVG
jgi:hypothetical protein